MVNVAQSSGADATVNGARVGPEPLVRQVPGRRRRQHSVSGKQITAIIGPSGCGKSTLLRCLNRMNDLIPGVRVEGDVLFEGENLYAPDIDRGRSAPAHRHGVPEAEPVPEDRSTTTSPSGRGSTASKATWTRSSSTRCEQAALWDEVKDKLEAERPRPFRRPAAAPVHRARPRRRARGHPDGRAVLRARPHRHAEIEELMGELRRTTRSSS